MLRSITTSERPPEYTSVVRERTVMDNNLPHPGNVKHGVTKRATGAVEPRIDKRVVTGEKRILLQRTPGTLRLRDIILATLDREINAVADECEQNPNSSFQLVESQFMSRLDLSLIGEDEVDELYDLELDSMRRLWGRVIFVQ